MMDVVRSLVSETTGFLVTHYGSSFVDFFDEFPLYSFPFELQSLWIWHFLPHLWLAVTVEGERSEEHTEGWTREVEK